MHTSPNWIRRIHNGPCAAAWAGHGFQRVEGEGEEEGEVYLRLRGAGKVEQLHLRQGVEWIEKQQANLRAKMAGMPLVDCALQAGEQLTAHPTHAPLHAPHTPLTAHRTLHTAHCTPRMGKTRHFVRGPPLAV